MIQLTPAEVRLAVPARGKDDAIRAVGQVLVEGGYIAPGYVESMLGRERQANTYLGKGVAIPHGMGKDRELIHRTGIAVVQVAGDGVEWSDGQRARLVVGIAARSDEHIAVLSALTDVLDDTALAERLATTRDPADIVAALTSRMAPREPSADAAAPIGGDAVAEVRIVDAAGLHARPATALTEVAARFASDVRVQHGARTANGKALASLLGLGAEGGALLRIAATGPDAAAAVAALRAAVAAGLEPDDAPAPEVEAGPAWTPVSDGRAVTGLPASPGVAIGTLFRVQETRLAVARRTVADPDAERHALAQALETAREQLEDVHDSVAERAGKGEAAIFRAHQALLQDEELRGEVDALIARGHDAASAWQEMVERRAAELRQVGNERLAARATDLHDVGQRVLRALVGTAPEGAAHYPDGPVILVAEDLTPSDTARLDPKRILGLCTVAGGPTSHTAIIARSLEIPAVVGAGAELLELPVGGRCILDGGGGRLFVAPSDADVESAEAFRHDLRARRDQDHERRYEPALMLDGHRVEVVANIGKAVEAQQAVDAGAEGVGLMRTEFLFLDREAPPTEEEQYEAYRTMLAALRGLPLILRTLDIGGDKVVPYLSLPKEDNPFLGVRGIRLCLRKPELFVPQLRAIYRASAHGPLKIMLPMIATVEELREARAVAERVRSEIGAAPVEIGIMIEVPSAVAMAAELAREADFFSVGTNDLTQYVLAMDRMHPTLGAHADGLHPAVLRMIDQTVRAADAAGRWVGVCGGIAGELTGALILTGLGVRELSMSIPSVAAVKAALRRHTLMQAQAFAGRALGCATAGEVRALPLPRAARA